MICLLTLAIFFREFLDSGFNLIAGNPGDNRFVIAILEHWRAVSHGRAFFTSPNFFWPQQGVLGYSESFFLLALPYIAGRAAGMDPYLAFELVLILFKAVGFFSMLWLLRSFIGVSRSAALVGSALFALSNLYFISVGHGHLMTVVFVPLLVALACAGWRAYGRQKIVAYAYGGSFGLLLALVLFTSFYIGWFAILAGGVAIVSALLGGIFRARTLSPLREWIRATVDRGPMLAAAALVFSVALIPFLITYLPTLKQTGGRNFQQDLIYTAQPLDVINIGQGNWIWGRSLEALMVRLGHAPMVAAEVQMGWSPLTLGLVAVGILLGFGGWSLRRSTGPTQSRRRFPIAVLSASFITCWVLSLKIGERSLWWLIFEFIPGGSAIRVPARFNLVLNVFVMLIACLVLEELKKRAGRSQSVVFWGLSLFLIAEQINTAPGHLIRRHSENAILGRAHRPPATCASFFLAQPVT
ncbi:MAG: hypothetical protein M3Y72_11910, partial [Acidobacteriota bacterium]|nr:hypothetical protein [Acidobacteriota bacterium]